MSARSNRIEINIGQEKIAGTMLSPRAKVPGLLFVHGWGGSQGHDMDRARGIAALGCVCLTFDLRGHALTEAQHFSVTREDNLCDVVAAYDLLASEPAVDKSEIAVVGSSYGGYLATILTSLRPVKWLGLRAPALYRDEDWHTPKRKLDQNDLATYRRGPVASSENRALEACSNFRGDVLLVESEHDDLVPHQTILSYRAAFTQVQSLTYRVMAGADHRLSNEKDRQAYSAFLTGWATEMILGARSR